MKLNSILLFITSYLTLCLVQSHSIVERSLLFTEFTVMQYNYGVSAPAILPNRSINLSLGVQHNWVMPHNLTQVRPKDWWARESTVLDYDLDRTTFYEHIITMLNSCGLDGRACLLRTICEVAETPLHINENNLYERLLHYIFTPSIDSKRTKEENKSSYLLNKSLKAEFYGVSGMNCSKYYSKCDISIIDLITAKFMFF